MSPCRFISLAADSQVPRYIRRSMGIMRSILLVHPSLPRSNLRCEWWIISESWRSIETGTYRCCLYSHCHVWVSPLPLCAVRKDRSLIRNMDDGADSSFGWSGAYPEVHWFVPIFFTGFFGMSYSTISFLVPISWWRWMIWRRKVLMIRNRSIHLISNYLCIPLRFISWGISFGIHIEWSV